MRSSCNIIRDILPLYVENMVSADTVSFVEEHLATCEDCRTALASMKNSNEAELLSKEEIIRIESEANPLKNFAKKYNKRKRIIVITLLSVILIVVLLASCLISYLKFDTANPVIAANGFVQIVFSEKEYIVIQNSPKVILAQPYASLEYYMESRGFTEIEDEQLGALRVFTNGNEKEYVMYSLNRYFSKWSWK